MLNSLSSALMLYGLVFSLGEHSPARPQALELSVRLLFVTPGMGVDDATRVLRLQGQKWYGGGGLDSWCRMYDIDPEHTLVLSFHFDEKRSESVLVKTQMTSGTELARSAPEGQPVRPPAGLADYARIKIRGKLTRAGKQWFVEVKQPLGDSLAWDLDFASADVEQTAAKLAGKRIILSGELIRPFHLPGIGGESFLVPPPQPRVLVRSLRAGRK